MKKLILYILLFLGYSSQAQTTSDTIVTDTTQSSRLIAKSEVAYFVEGDEGWTQYLIDNVKIYVDSTYMFCDSATILNQNIIKAMGNVIILQTDSLKIFADTVYYNSDSLKADLINNVVLEKGENQMFSNHIYYNTGTRIANYYDTASFFLKRTKLKSVKGVYDVNLEKASFFEKVNMIDSTFNLRTDTLDFYTKLEKLIFRAPTIIDQGSKKIYCESGFYDIKNGLSEFSQNANYVDGSTNAKGHQINYNSNINEIELIGDAIFQDSTQTAMADKIVYNEVLKNFDLYGSADYKNGEKQIVGDTIYYNDMNKSLKTTGRSNIVEKDFTLDADLIDFVEAEGHGYAEGDIIYKDKKADLNVKSEKMFITEDMNRIKVFSINQKPLLESIIDQDTMFLTSDTLFTHNYEDSTGTSYKRVKAFHQVKIYKSDLQAVADSMYYDTKKEIITLYHNPIMWSDTSQFTGDSVQLILKNKKIHKIILQPNAFISQSQDEIYFNQISGKKIVINFNDSTISQMIVTGNAQSLFYMTDDDKKYVGLSKTICSSIKFDFNNGDLSRSLFYPKPNTEIIPMNQASHDQIKLKGFTWHKDRRPISLEDILKLDQPAQTLITKDTINITLDSLITEPIKQTNPTKELPNKRPIQQKKEGIKPD